MADLVKETRIRTQLQRHAPAMVRVLNADGTPRDLAVPTSKKRWHTVAQLMAAMEWTRAELLDKSGALVGIIDNEGPATDLEDVTGREAKEANAVERYVRMVVTAQDQAVARYHQMIGPTMTVLTDTVKLLAARIDRLEREREEPQVQYVPVPMPADDDDDDEPTPAKESAMDKLIPIVAAKLLQNLS